MMLRKLLIGSIIFFSIHQEAKGQCSGGSNGGNLTPAPASTYQTASVSAGTYYAFNVASAGCDSYTFTFCSNGGSAGFDTQITILDNAGNPVAGGYNDDFCGLQSEITWTPSSAGVYYVLINSYYCNSSGSGTLAYIFNSSSNGNYSMIGDANSPSPYDCVQLTANTAGQTGCAWDSNSTLDFSSGFTYDFTVNLGSNDGGADGIAFVIQNDPAGICACGGSGGGFAASGISNSLIVEIDTYLNTEDRDDGASMYAQGVLCAGGTEPDHLDLWLSGNVNPPGAVCNTSPGARIIPSAEPLMFGGSPYNVENGQDHILRVTWVPGAPGTFTATLMDLGTTITYASVSYSFDPPTQFGTNTPFFGFTAATGGLSNEQIFCNPPILLPIEMGSFDVICSGDSRQLTWETVTELNNDYFTVFRSFDGQNYEPIGKVDGAGTSSETMRYEFTDDEPVIGQVYYTLMQTDENGEEKFTGMIRIAECSGYWVIYPNPQQSGSELVIINPTNSIAELNIYTVTGELVFHSIMDQNKNCLQPGLSSGIYQVIISSENTGVITSERLVVSN